jgi:hypothetical protein
VNQSEFYFTRSRNITVGYGEPSLLDSLKKKKKEHGVTHTSSQAIEHTRIPQTSGRTYIYSTQRHSHPKGITAEKNFVRRNSKKKEKRKKKGRERNLKSAERLTAERTGGYSRLIITIMRVIRRYVQMMISFLG